MGVGLLEKDRVGDYVPTAHARRSAHMPYTLGLRPGDVSRGAGVEVGERAWHGGSRGAPSGESGHEREKSGSGPTCRACTRLLYTGGRSGSRKNGNRMADWESEPG
jgi:hypothetical protein